EKYGLAKKEAVWMALSLFMAGQETTHTSLRAFTLALLHHPHVVQEAQKQLDAVCGERPPTFQDRERLPYVDAVIRETLRWRPPLPLGIAHRASEVRLNVLSSGFYTNRPYFRNLYIRDT
ncbi:cytochrome P450, partial [Calocera cornea HHB12733]